MWPFGRHRPCGQCQSDQGDSAALGRRGEKLAADALRRAGLSILARNYRCPAGEVDLIALGDDVVVFAEVKTRASDYFTAPAAAVDSAKQRHLRRSADYYFATHPDAAGMTRRFDVISIVAADGQPPRLEHIADAFR